MKAKIRSKDAVCREQALAELELVAQGRHCSQQSVLERYQQCSDWRQASSVLVRALPSGHRGVKGVYLTPPPGWLPPTL